MYIFMYITNCMCRVYMYVYCILLQHSRLTLALHYLPINPLKEIYFLMEKSMFSYITIATFLVVLLYISFV